MTTQAELFKKFLREEGKKKEKYEMETAKVVRTKQLATAKKNKYLSQRTKSLVPIKIKQDKVVLHIKEYQPEPYRSRFFKNQIEKERSLFFKGGENII
jgi:hypothetical protein